MWFKFCYYSFLPKVSRMALYLPTFTIADAPILNHPIQLIPKPSLQLHFSKPISRNHFSVPHSATQPQKYVYPDPIPEFAVAETHKFRAELLKKLSKEKEILGDELDDVVSVCAESALNVQKWSSGDGIGKKMNTF